MRYWLYALSILALSRIIVGLDGNSELRYYYVNYGIYDQRSQLIGEGSSFISINMPIGKVQLTPKIIDNIKQNIKSQNIVFHDITIRNWIETVPDYN